MGERPVGTSLLKELMSDGNYEPDNCRWATRDRTKIKPIEGLGQRKTRIKLN
jgi:hypothetical protein